MASPVNKRVKVLEAKYVEDAESILILAECEEGQLRTQIHKSSFSFGERTPSEITYEMHKTAALMEGKTLNLLFTDTIDDYEGLKAPRKRESIAEDNIHLLAKGLGL